MQPPSVRFWGWFFPFVLVHYLSVFPSTQSITLLVSIYFFATIFFLIFSDLRLFRGIITLLVCQIMNGWKLTNCLICLLHVFLWNSYFFIVFSPGLSIMVYYGDGWRGVYVSMCTR